MKGSRSFLYNVCLSKKYFHSMSRPGKCQGRSRCFSFHQRAGETVNQIWTRHAHSWKNFYKCGWQRVSDNVEQAGQIRGQILSLSTVTLNSWETGPFCLWLLKIITQCHLPTWQGEATCGASAWSWWAVRTLLCACKEEKEDKKQWDCGQIFRTGNYSVEILSNDPKVGNDI